MNDRRCPVCGDYDFATTGCYYCRGKRDEQRKKDYADRLQAELDAAKAENAELVKQINRLASVLLDEFNGPDDSESACDMAIKVLRKALENDTKIKGENVELYMERNDLRAAISSFMAENAALQTRAKELEAENERLKANQYDPISRNYAYSSYSRPDSEGMNDGTELRKL